MPEKKENVGEGRRKITPKKDQKPEIERDKTSLRPPTTGKKATEDDENA